MVHELVYRPLDPPNATEHSLIIDPGAVGGRVFTCQGCGAQIAIQYMELGGVHERERRIRAARSAGRSEEGGEAQAGAEQQKEGTEE